MEDFLSRIQLVIDKLFSGNQAAFARAIGIKPTTLSNYFSDKKATKPSTELALSTASILGVDGNWLLTGSGDMGVGTSSKEDDIDTHAPNSVGKVVGRVYYHNSERIGNIAVSEDSDETHSAEHPQDIEEMAFALNCENVDLKNEIKERESDIRELKARLEECYKTIDLLKSLLTAQK